MAPHPKRKYTLEEYFELERSTNERFGYRNGDIFSMSGGSDQHDQIEGNTFLNPALIIEVLSDSTEAYDRGDKFTHYKSIPAFVEYLLIAQHRPHITQYAKLEDGSWSYRELNDVSASVNLSSVDCVLELSDVYRDVAFPDPHSANIKGESEIIV